MSKYGRWLVLPLSLTILFWILVFDRENLHIGGLGQAITLGIFFLFSLVLIVILLKLKFSFFIYGFALLILSIFMTLMASLWQSLDWLRTIAFFTLTPAGFVLMFIHLVQTSRKQQQFLQQLDASEDRFRLVFENAKDAIFIEQLDGKILAANQAACELFGYSKEEMLQLSVFDLVPAEVHEKIPDLRPASRPNGKFFLEEVYNLHKSGKKISVEVSANRIFIGGTEVVVAIVRDISERKKNERSLLLTNRRLRLFNRISLLIHEHRNAQRLLQTVTHDISRWLKGSAHLTFLPEETRGVMSLVSQEHFPPDFPATLSLNLLNKLFSGNLIHVKFYPDLTAPELQQPIGKFDLAASLKQEHIHSLLLLPFYSQKRLIALAIIGNLKFKIRNQDLQLLQTICNHVGVAIENINLYRETRGWALELESRVEQRTTELMKSENQFRQMVESIKDGFFTTDQNLNLTYWNSGFELTTGRSGEIIKNKNLFEVWSGLPQNEVTKIIRQVNELRQFQTLQFFCQDERMSAWFSVRFYPWEEGIAVFYDNITNQKQAEEALKAANEDLQSFAYSVSHDLRTPLRAIDGFAKMLADELPQNLDPTLWHYLDRIRSGAKNLNFLINDLLVFSRVTRQEPRRYEIDTRDVFANLIQEVHEQEPERKIEFQLGILPVVNCDIHLFEILGRNLISNAAKFSRPRDRAVIEIGSYPEQGKDIIFIKDNGVGFDMKYHDRIFGVFQRLHTTEAFEGTGIGLATVKRIVEKYGGKIWAESTDGHGATFFFYL
jgi:PAS domain S-box-containing protein